MHQLQLVSPSLSCSIVFWFLSQGFPFLAMSKFSCMRFRLFITCNVHTLIFLPIFVFWFFFVLLMLVLSVLFHFTLRYPRWNGYRRRRWTRRHELKSWTRLIAFHIALIPLGKVWIRLFSLQLWVNSRADWLLQPWQSNLSRRRIQCISQIESFQNYWCYIYIYLPTPPLGQDMYDTRSIFKQSLTGLNSDFSFS